MNQQVVIGAGPVGSGIACTLAERGEAVTVVTRSGSGPEHPLITKARADAGDSDQLAQLAQGAVAIYNCANPPYHRWDTDWPPIHSALMAAAEKTGAVLVMMDNLYGFGRGTAMPMHELDPTNTTGVKGAVRAAMEKDLLEAHAAGTLRATFARASDFYGPGVRDAGLGERVWNKLLAGKKVSVLGELDTPHSISYMPDVVQTMITIAGDERAWGKPWHVPNAPACTQREVINAFAVAAGTTAKVGAVPKSILRALGVFSPLLKALRETEYQFSEPWITDSSLTEQTFGLRATSLADAASATAAWWRAESTKPGATK
ncbi:MAG: NAD-dependent epimerase/dehydratase family protein [Actinomycetia bacterium]|nr:NAD-dependent epimerase/dehydratase family protein [Actinomycetes bacterium]